MIGCPLGRSAAWYATRRGWAVFPLIPKDKRPLAQHGVLDATTDPKTIMRWWQTTPAANIGLAMGDRSGVFALDIDGEIGAATLAELERANDPLPETVEAKTAHGRHLLFKMPPGVEIRNSAGKIGAGLDVRGSGGYIAVAPSIHPSGVEYRWIEGRKPNQVSAADPPAWLLELLAKPEAPVINGHANSKANGITGERLSKYASAALSQEIAAMARAPEGQRNDQLNRSAFALAQLVAAEAIELDVVGRALFGAAAAAGLDQKEARRTIAAAFEAGRKQPRQLPEELMRPATAPTARIQHAPISQAEKTWPELDPAALQGLAGEVVNTLDPHTEADPAAILVQFLTAFGNAIGRGPHFTAEADRHGANLFAVFVGETAKARKGTSWSQAKRVVAMADETWSCRIASGLSSGEGLIWQVRDEEVADKRLLVFEAEFASVLQVLSREGNTLSAVVRNAWDVGDLRTLTKNDPAIATGAHVSIIGHVTRDELVRHLQATEAGNGFANRFLWICVRRSKLLPEGGSLDPAALVPLAQSVRDTLADARQLGQLRRDAKARSIWHEVYPALSDGRPGLLGAVTARGEAQVMRLALIYALLDRSDVINASHLRAALAVWDYAETSAEFIFGDKLGDPVADSILSALRQVPDGLTRTELRDLFGRNRSADRIDSALASLERLKKVQRRTEPSTGGRPPERWVAVSA